MSINGNLHTAHNFTLYSSDDLLSLARRAMTTVMILDAAWTPLERLVEVGREVSWCQTTGRRTWGLGVRTPENMKEGSEYVLTAP